MNNLQDDEEIHQNSESRTASAFKIRKWTLELEDATASDSGYYVCEVFNGVGEISRRFHVEIQDRIRSRPYIIPMILTNQTVDVGTTANFSCMIFSDMTPYIVWIKLIEEEKSYIRWDKEEKQWSFNFLDMAQVEVSVRRKFS